jgi:hypothetical protein
MLRILYDSKERVVLNIPIMCYQFINKNRPRDNSLFCANKSICAIETDQVLNTRIVEIFSNNEKGGESLLLLFNNLNQFLIIKFINHNN